MKKYYFLVFLIAVGINIWAVDANDFLIGTYSQYQIRYAGTDYADNFEDLGNFLHNAGYNATTYSLSDNFTSQMSTIFPILETANIKSMLLDGTWDIGNNKVGVSSLSFGNRLQIEAEYQLKTSTSGSFIIDELSTDNQLLCMESYDYVTMHDRGEYEYNTGDVIYSNDFAWICDASVGHVAGVALSHPRKRWKPSWEQRPSLISKDIMFYRYAINDNKLYITVAMRFEDIAVGNSVADISLKLYNPLDPNLYSEYEPIPDPSRYVSIPLISTNSSLYDSSITAQTYPTSLRDEYGNYVFEYYVNMSTLTSYMTPVSSTRHFFHINPEIFWYGNGKLIVDYITIEDEFNRSVRLPNSPYISHLNNQINDLTSMDTNNNLLYLMSMDEPFSGQLQMYKHMQNHLNSLNPARMLITAMWLKDYGINKHDGTPYNYHTRFLHETNPDRIMVDVYPLKGSIVWNGNMGGAGTVQTKIDNIIHYYYHKLVSNVQQSNNPDTEIFYIPQTFGVVRQDTGEWSYNMPPRSMVKALKYLPLCYAADGMVDFIVASNPIKLVEGGYWIAPLTQDQAGEDFTNQYNNLRITDNVSAYNMITDANSKIAIYGPIIRELHWLNANKLMTNGIALLDSLYGEDQINLTAILLDNLHVEAEEDETGYTGHIQCGYYSDAGSNPYFMIVNRRAVYARSGVESIPLKFVDLRFTDAAAQTVHFVPDNTSHNIFGSHIALYDPYDNSIYQTVSGEINVCIGPGDGRLLQMCSSLPSSVTSNADIKKIAYLSGNVTIDSCTVVTVHPGTKTTIFPHSIIRVKGGSTFNLTGEVVIMDSVSIIIEQGSTINLDDAICTWGQDSKLEISGSVLTSTNSLLECASGNQKWQGIRASRSSTITLTETNISGADYNEVIDSDVYVNNCRFNIPSNSVGLLVDNATPDNTIRIVSTVDEKGFYGEGGTSLGLVYGNQDASTFMNRINFVGLQVGLANLYNSAIRDTVINCNFINNTTGIYVIGSAFSPLITDCYFNENELGAYFEVASPEIRECNFVSCDEGIRTEMSTGSTGGIFACIFSWGETGIVSRGSNLRVADNQFYTDNGILNHSGSVLNMGNTAKNLFNAEVDNLKFQDTVTYNARVQLYLGHNDFYHENQEPLTATRDFHFDGNWYVSPPPRSNAINASYNWFEDGLVNIKCPGTPSDYVIYSALDHSPNVPVEGLDRMCLALGSEKQEDYIPANNTYKTILNEDIVAESDILYDALDGYYRTSDMVGDTPAAVESYLLAKISQYDINNPILTKYIQDYLVKNYLRDKAYQEAIDLIQSRLDNHESDVDSLLAVLDLEIVLQLAAMDEDKKPITTKYTQYCYPSFKVFSKKHDEHWAKLYALLGNGEELEIPVPPIPQISTNYPNPFNPSTTIVFSIPKDAKTKLTVFNIKGQKVKDIINSDLSKGYHKAIWDGKDSTNRSVSSGIYFIRLESGGKTSVRKSMLMK